MKDNSEYNLSFKEYFKKTLKQTMTLGIILLGLVFLLVLASHFTEAVGSTPPFNLSILPINLSETNLYCYQESANTSNQTGIDTQNCNLNYNGNYNQNNTWTDNYNIIDGNWSSYSGEFSNQTLFINYTKPSSFALLNSLWQVKSYVRTSSSVQTRNLSLINCWNGYSDKVVLKIEKYSVAGGGRNEFFCYNSTNWLNLTYSPIGNIDNGGIVYEEGIFWNISYSINLSLKAHSKFNIQELTGQFKINDTNITPNNNLLPLGKYNLSFYNSSYYTISNITTFLSSGVYLFTFTNISNTNITIQVLDNDTKINITGVTLSLTYGSITETNSSTTSNITTFEATQNLTYTLTASKTNYITQSINVTPNNTSYPITINLSPSNKVYITIKDDTTNLVIPQLIYVYFQNNASLFNYSTTTGYLNATNVTSGDYTISFITANGNYSTRSYKATIDDSTSPSITARLLLNSSTSQIGIYTKKTTYEILGNVLVTVQKQYSGGSYATVQQIVTDVNGFGILNINNGDTYRIILSADDFDTKQFEVIFYTANSPYTWLLTESSEGPYTNYLDGVQYYIYPNTSQITPGVINFSITTYNANFTVSWTSVNTNGTITNVSGSPGGATANKVVNLTGFEGLYNVTFSFNYLNPDTNTYVTINIPRTYYTKTYTYYNNSVVNSLDDFKNQLTNEPNVTGGVWQVILALFITIIAIVTVMQISGNMIAGIVVGMSFSIFFAVIGWLSVPMIAAQMIVMTMILFMQR